MRNDRTQLQLYLRAKEYAHKIFQRNSSCTLENARNIFTADLYKAVVDEYSVIDELYRKQMELNFAFAKDGKSYSKVSKVISDIKNATVNATHNSVKFVEAFEKYNFDGRFNKFLPTIESYKFGLNTIEKKYNETFSSINDAMKKIPTYKTSKDMQLGLLAVEKETKFLLNGACEVNKSMMKIIDEMLEGSKNE